MDKNKSTATKAAIETLKIALQQINELPDDDYCSIGEEIDKAIPELWKNKAACAIEFAHEISLPSYEKKKYDFETLLNSACVKTMQRFMDHVWQLGRAVKILENPEKYSSNDKAFCISSLSDERKRMMEDLNDELYSRIHWYARDIEEFRTQKQVAK